MEIFEYPTETLLNSGFKLLINRHVCHIFSEATTRMVCVPGQKMVDEELCYSLGYRVQEFLYDGGVIVVEVGDIDIADFGKLGNTFKDDFLTYLTEWLVQRGLNAKFENNDVLVDDYKVCGAGGRRHTGIDYTTIHIGINTNVENIGKICTKEMRKIPKGLSEYGITSEDIRKVFTEFCTKYHEEGIEWIK